MKRKEKKKREETSSQVYKDFAWRESLGEEPVFLERKKALIDRDPLTKDLLKELQAYDPQQGRSPRLNELLNQVEEKWFVSIYIPSELRYDAQQRGLPPEKIYQKAVEKDIVVDGNKFLEAINCKPMSDPFVIRNRFQIEPIVFCIPTDLGTPHIFGERHFNDNLTIQIDLNLITLRSAPYVKDTVWKIVEKYLRDGIPDNSTIMKTLYVMEAPGYDIEEVMYLYRCSPSTFQKYLRWYDTHTQEKLPFRLIAFLENKRREGLKSYDEWIEKLRTTKWKVGREYIKGQDAISEDAVEKAIKLIWRAIHRKTYTRVKGELEDWTCPIHGNNLQTGSRGSPGYLRPDGTLIIKCEYCKALYDKFKRIESMNKGRLPLADDDLIDQISHVRTGRLPRKKNTRHTDGDEE